MDMQLGIGLQIQQTQRLIMTPELRQAIAVLQLPVVELSDVIEAELLDNPCLEAEAKEESEDPSQTKKLLDYLGRGYNGGGGITTDPDDDYSFEAYTPTLPTLREHLMAQLQLTSLPKTDRRIGEFLIDSLDDHGYLTLATAEVALKLGVPDAQVLSVLLVVHSFDPAGVGARSLKECLQLQWATVDDGNEVVPLLINHHLDQLGDGRITKIAEELGVTPLCVQTAADLIRGLDPKPGRRFCQPNETRYVIPDVVIERVGKEYVVQVNEAQVPKLLVSNHYRQMLADPADSDTRKFVEQKINAAIWLIKAIEQRRMTLQKVTEAILKFQRDFFDSGVRHLRPLTLRDVADVVGVHESTVSRATSAKYVQTPQGTFELKFFFTSGVEGAWGEGVAAESVQRLIADLITKEDTTEPLSDQTLTGLLNKQGVHISRRTVAKYREEMGVPSSPKRKRYK
jgi:RNA polymerase sigma-54 factor